MSGSTDVTLAKSHTPDFPQCCVVCGASNPGASIRFVTLTSRWWVWLTLLPSGLFSAEVPACSFCGWRLQLRRLFNSVVIVAAVLVAVWYIWPYVKDQVPRGLRPWVQVGIGLALVFPKFMYDLIYPPAFDVIVGKDQVTYEFRDSWYAVLFAGMNRSAMVGDNLFGSVQWDNSSDKEDPPSN